MYKKISFIGVGNMATAVISGITSRADDPIDWSDLILHDKDTDKVEKYSRLGASAAQSLADAITRSNCVILCVKPQNFQEVLSEISEIPDVDKKLFVTIAAGISTETVSEAAHGAAVVRVMPNTPMLIGCGVSAICKNDAASDDDLEYVCNIFKSSGSVVKINENEMNRIICVSGSSPAYVFMLIKAMIDGACKQGLVSVDEHDGRLSEKEITDVICDTVIGSAMLLKSGGCSPEDQIKRVCSKGGTTEQAVAELEERGFYEAILSAMQKCTKRADELGNKN